MDEDNLFSLVFESTPAVSRRLTWSKTPVMRKAQEEEEFDELESDCGDAVGLIDHDYTPALLIKEYVPSSTGNLVVTEKPTSELDVFKFKQLLQNTFDARGLDWEMELFVSAVQKQERNTHHFEKIIKETTEEFFLKNFQEKLRSFQSATAKTLQDMSNKENQELEKLRKTAKKDIASVQVCFILRQIPNSLKRNRTIQLRVEKALAGGTKRKAAGNILSNLAESTEKEGPEEAKVPSRKPRVQSTITFPAPTKSSQRIKNKQKK